MRKTISLATWLLLSGAGLAALPQEGDKTQADGKKKGVPEEKSDVDPDSMKSVWEYLAARYDANGDGKISAEEYSRGTARFTRLDRDGSGFIEKADTEQGGRSRRGSRGRVQAPSEGAVAPNFKLETLQPRKVESDKTGSKGSAKDKGKEVQKETFGVVELSSFKDKKPVALIFGSYT